MPTSEWNPDRNLFGNVLKGLASLDSDQLEVLQDTLDTRNAEQLFQLGLVDEAHWRTIQIALYRMKSADVLD